jgi:hypothetical protein
MYTTDLAEFKTRQRELHRQAEQYRLLKSLKGNQSSAARIKKAIGRALIFSGEQLLTLAGAPR